MMAIEEVKALLLYSLALNFALLLVWAVAFIGAHERLYRLHSRWFQLSRETFDAIHYAGMAVYKMAILLFNLVPLLALYLLY